MILQQFINAGWHTVPLKGELKRTEGGGKTIPKFPADWRTLYAKKFNEEVVPLGGAMTGAVSNIVAIDCDSQLTWNIFRELDPEHDFCLVSKGKPSGGCTLIYKYDPDLVSFKGTDEMLKLDFYSDTGFIYLPTEANETKETWTREKLPELREMPSTIKALLLALAKRKTVEKQETAHRGPAISNRLAPMVKDFNKGGAYVPVLFKIITPKAFRDLPQYVKQGHLHPNDVPQGRGSEYLSCISAILGRDISISKTLYQETMFAINKLFTAPMENKRLLATIINPMVEEKTIINGEVVWSHDKHWEKHGFVATTKRGEYLESFYDDKTGLYYLINHSAPYVKTYTDKKPVISAVETMTGRNLTRVQYDSTIRLFRTQFDPSREFGQIEGTEDFNLFRQTPELNVLNNPSEYTPQYKRPINTIKYFETLVPDDFMRAYLLSFIKTKLKTFNYSPVVLYFIGTHGSGKDTFMHILGKIIGIDHIGKPEVKTFLENHNGWIMGKYFAHLDEYGDKLTGAAKTEALGRIKSYSGSPEVQIRAMRRDGVNYTHSMTIVMTANRNVLPIETEDRRIAYMETPNKLADAEWVIEAGGMSAAWNMIDKEVMDFCYYLATEITELHPDQYGEAPKTTGKDEMILRSMPTYTRIVHYLVKKKFAELEALAAEYGIPDFTRGWDHGKIEYDALARLYEAITEGAGDARAITKALKDIGIKREHTTRTENNNPETVYFFRIEGIQLHSTNPFEEDKEVETHFNDTAVKAL
ncbi:MAG: hypothetical protein K0U41_03590 [Gammaproteobacteria bacterium]|nr:hypothetical protein [Gammaproteobacteria bacterium]